MALIQFKDYPNTDTPLNTENLNNNFNELDNCVGLLNNYLKTGWVRANEEWVYSSVDDPTGVITIDGDVTNKYSLGMRIKFLNGGNTIYGIITKLEYFSPNTILTFLHEIKPSTSKALYLMTNASITDVFFSTMKAPYNFPVDKSKWTIRVTNGDNLTQSNPVSGTVYNLGGISFYVPIGVWNINYEAILFVDRGTSGTVNFISSLSESNNAETNAICGLMNETSPVTASANFNKNGGLYTSTTKKQLFIIGKTNVSSISRILLNGASVPTIITMECTYL